MLPALRNVPTLILMGERDGVVPACHGQTIADLIAGAELEVVPGSHLFPFTHAASVAARITAFLDRPTAGKRQAAARDSLRSPRHSPRAPPHPELGRAYGPERGCQSLLLPVGEC